MEAEEMDTGKWHHRPVTPHLLSLRKAPVHRCIMGRIWRDVFSFRCMSSWPYVDCPLIQFISNRNWMKESRYTVTFRCPLHVSRVNSLHEILLIRTLKSLVLSVSVRLAESRSQTVSGHAAVSLEERPSPLGPACPSNTQTKWWAENTFAGWTVWY